MYKKLKVMLVEDNPADVELFKYSIKKSMINIDLIVFNDGQSAIDYIWDKEDDKEGDLPDVIILDINVPKLSGIDILKRLKAHDIFKIIPVIMLTTSSAEEDIHESYMNFANAYLVKPVEVDQFLKVMTKFEEFVLQIVKIPKVRRR